MNALSHQAGRLSAVLWPRHRTRRLLVIVLLLLVVSALKFAISDQQWGRQDSAANAGAAVVSGDPFGDDYHAVQVMNQGWDDGDSLWFYTVTQGSDLLPYDFFLALKSADTGIPLKDQRNVLRWRYLPQQVTRSNPDGLPVGLVRDHYKGQDFLGFSCAACHTGQLTYQGTALRINGGPSLANMPLFMSDLEQALGAVAHLDGQGRACADDACRKFVADVRALGHYDSDQAVVDDLRTFRIRISAYNLINDTSTAYGYARLDAFGRIYNRVLEHVQRPGTLAALLPQVFDAPELGEVQHTLADLLVEPPRPGLLHVLANGVGLVQDPSLHPVVEQALARLAPEPRQKLKQALFNEPNAPVSYPYLWDVPYSDYVQWNALAGNGELGPVGRNAGEVIGVFGTLDWMLKSGFSVSALIDGQTPGETHLSFESSVDVHTLARIEHHLHSLRSPPWPVTLMGALDPDKVKRGGKLFDVFCESCHHKVDAGNPDRRLVVNVSKLGLVGTDPTMAANSVARNGHSGLLRNQYAKTFTQGDLLLTESAPAAALLTKATTGVVATPYPESNPLRRLYNFTTDLVFSFFTNKMKSSLKMGNYDPDTPADPYASLRSYKARPLNGIWATAPYLHNGSVPTLRDLLLPVAERPVRFMVGSREFDPVKVGLRSAGYAGFEFDTGKPGNSNAGHEYGVAGDRLLARLGRGPLTEQERDDLLEYLKSL